MCVLDEEWRKREKEGEGERERRKREKEEVIFQQGVAAQYNKN